MNGPFGDLVLSAIYPNIATVIVLLTVGFEEKDRGLTYGIPVEEFRHK